MDFKTFFFKKILLSYFLVVTGITAAAGIVGSIYMPHETFGYQAFLSPFLFGLIAVIPSLVTYSRKELSIKQMFFRFALHFLLLEVMILYFAYLEGLLRSRSITVSLFLSVLIIDLTVRLVMWLNDRHLASELNNALRKMQETDK